MPTLIFVNKIDRRGADASACCGDRREAGAGDRPDGIARPDASRRRRRDDVFTRLALLADHDDELLAAYVDDEPVPTAASRELAEQTGGAVHPVFFGSAAPARASTR